MLSYIGCSPRTHHRAYWRSRPESAPIQSARSLLATSRTYRKAYGSGYIRQRACHLPRTEIPLKAILTARGAHLSQIGGGQQDRTRHALTALPKPIQTHITTPKSPKTAKTHKIPAIDTTPRRQHRQNRRRYNPYNNLFISMHTYINMPLCDYTAQMKRINHNQVKLAGKYGVSAPIRTNFNPKPRTHKLSHPKPGSQNPGVLTDLRLKRLLVMEFSALDTRFAMCFGGRWRCGVCLVLS